MENLEGLAFEEVIHPDGTSYAVFRKNIKPGYLTTWANIISGFLALFLLFLLFILLTRPYPVLSWLLIPPFALAGGLLIAFLNLFIHEAGHYYIHPRRKWNDILANVFLCSWTGVDIKVYRKIHWKHHLHLATRQDTENSYFHPLTLTLILETLTGIHLFKIILSKNDKSFLTVQQRKRSIWMLVAGLIINTSLLAFFIYYKYPQAAVVWSMSLIIFFPFFATIRQLLEHRHEQAGNFRDYYRVSRNKISRIFKNDVLSRVLGAAGFSRHMIHHWDPELPFTGLKQAEEFLSACDRTREIINNSRTTYLKVFKKLFVPPHG